MVLLRVYKFAMNIDDHWGFLRTVVNCNNAVMFTDGKTAIIQVNSDTLKVPKSVANSRGELGLMIDSVYGKVTVGETDKYWHLQPLSNGIEAIDKLMFQVPFPVEEPVVGEVSVKICDKEPEAPKSPRKKRRASSRAASTANKDTKPETLPGKNRQKPVEVVTETTPVKRARRKKGEAR